MVDVTLAPDDVLRVVVPLPGTPISGMHREYTATFQARCARNVPLPIVDRALLPALGDLSVNLHHGHWGPFSLTIPIAVWPSRRQQCLWALLAIGALLLGPCRDLVQAKGNLFVAALLIFGLTIAWLIVLQIAGWLCIGFGARTE